MAMNERRRARLATAERDCRVRIDNAMAVRPAVALDIGEIVLRGIDVSDHYALAGALKGALASALGEWEMTRRLRSGAREWADGGTISLDANRGVSAIGRQIAQAVQRSLIQPAPSAGGAKISKR